MNRWTKWSGMAEDKIEKHCFKTHWRQVPDQWNFESEHPVSNSNESIFLLKTLKQSWDILLEQPLECSNSFRICTISQRAQQLILKGTYCELSRRAFSYWLLLAHARKGANWLIIINFIINPSLAMNKGLFYYALSITFISLHPHLKSKSKSLFLMNLNWPLKTKLNTHFVIPVIRIDGLKFSLKTKSSCNGRQYKLGLCYKGYLTFCLHHLPIWWECAQTYSSIDGSLFSCQIVPIGSTTTVLICIMCTHVQMVSQQEKLGPCFHLILSCLMHEEWTWKCKRRYLVACVSVHKERKGLICLSLWVSCWGHTNRDCVWPLCKRDTVKKPFPCT